MYRGPPSGGFMCCGDRNRAFRSEPEPELGKVVLLLKRDNTIVGSKRFSPCGAHTKPAAWRSRAGVLQPVTRDRAESRPGVHPLTRCPESVLRPGVHPLTRCPESVLRPGVHPLTRCPESVLRPGVHPLTRRPARHNQGREEWEPYVPAEQPSPGGSRDGYPMHTQHSNSHNAFYMEPGLTRERSSGMGEREAERRDKRRGRPLRSTERAGGTGHRDTRFYSSSPVPNGEVIPFRRKKEACAQGVSWADDEYWGRWHGWDEVIDWGDKVSDRAAKGPARGHLARPGVKTSRQSGFINVGNQKASL